MTPTRPEPTPLSPAILHGATRPDLLRDETLPDLLEATATRQPNHPALLWEGQIVPYGELNRRADLGAHRLLEHGAAPDKIIGLWLPRRIW